MTQPGEINGQAVLRDYPLRLWAQQQEHTHELLREFTLLLLGKESRQTTTEAPAQLVALNETFNRDHGPLIDRLNTERQAAFNAGADRMDSAVPMLPNVGALLDQVRDVLTAVDEYCRRGDMLALARPPELVALYDWTSREILAQQAGADPSPWPGPF